MRKSEASEPAWGSVSAKAPIVSPFASGFSHRSFCSAVPKRSIARQSGALFTDMTVETAPSPAAISSIAST